MRLFELRKQLKEEFSSMDIDSIDADFIISEVLNQPITMLPLIETIDDKDVQKVQKYAEKRKQHIPVNKIFKHTNFYGLDFKVNKFVLAPRQDSELLVDTALKYIKENQFKTALDLCTGSGCLAIAIKKNIDIDITASDISQQALSVAKFNADKNHVKVNFVLSNMFENIQDKFDIVITNPPYIATDDIDDLDEEVKNNDPILALDGGELGLDYYNIIHDNLRKHLNDNGIIIMEIGEDQRIMIESLFNDFELIEVVKDYNDVERVLVLKK